MSHQHILEPSFTNFALKYWLVSILVFYKDHEFNLRPIHFLHNFVEILKIKINDFISKQLNQHFLWKTQPKYLFIRKYPFKWKSNIITIIVIIRIIISQHNMLIKEMILCNVHVLYIRKLNVRNRNNSNLFSTLYCLVQSFRNKRWENKKKSNSRKSHHKYFHFFISFSFSISISTSIWICI